MIEQKGFTLVELLVAMVVGLLLIGSTYSLFQSSSEIYISQEQFVNIRQDIRTALFIMTREIRMAGLNPNRNATCAGIVKADSTSFHITYDRDENGMCDGNVAYRYDASVQILKKKIIKESGTTGGYQRFIYDVSSAQFSYVLDDGTISTRPTNLEHIRMINLQLCGTIHGSYSKKYNEPRCYNATIRCRNMGLQ